MASKRQKGRKEKQRRFNRSPQEALVKALNHPVRVKALTILSERAASPNEISEQLEEPLSNVSYHIRVLGELGLVELTEEVAVRGAVEHFYKAIERPLTDNPEWEKLDPNVRNVFSACLVETLHSDAAFSLASGYFDKRSDRHASRTPLFLDEQGWERVAAIQAKTLQRILKEQSDAAERINGGGDGIHAVVGMFFFEVPPDVDR
jgi:DNA-binding transcriptional ArsR family regulator